MVAKEGKSGVIQKGFQVKNSPQKGSDKVIFETLQDMFIDASLNELHPKGWNKSEQPLVPPANGEPGSTSSAQYSDVMLEPVIYLQGIGSEYAGRLGENFKIKDLLILDPDSDSVGLGINEIRMREWKAKADFLYQFAPPGDWSVISETALPDIMAISNENLAEQSGNTLEIAAALKHAIAMVEVCLDHTRYLELKYRQLIVPRESDLKFVQTTWHIATKPAVEPGEVAMISDDANDCAEAVMINRVYEIDAKPPMLELELLTSPLQNSWGEWDKGDTLLHYSPRWHRKPWLNGDDVIRTRETHGLNEDIYICWQNAFGNWRYAKIIETDRRNLRLKASGLPPEPGDRLALVSQFEGDQMAKEFSAIALVKKDGDITDPVELDTIVSPVKPELVEPPPGDNVDPIFEVIELGSPPSGGGGLLPPASLPKIGSFLFPSPMLPMDLVKIAVELLLSLGVMQIPSTKEFVIKGMPFGGMLKELDGANLDDPTALSRAAQKLFNLLRDLEMSVKCISNQVCDSDGNLLYDVNNAPIQCDGDIFPKMVRWHQGVLNNDGTVNESLAKTELVKLLQRATSDPTILFKRIGVTMNKETGPLLAIIPDKPAYIAVVSEKDPIYMFNSRPDRIQKDGWVVAEFSEGLSAKKIKKIRTFVDDDKTDSFGLVFYDTLSETGDLSNLSPPGELKWVHADFRGELVPHNATVNLSPIDPEIFELDEIPENLKVGQEVLITGCGDPYLTKITDIENNPFAYDLILMSVESIDDLHDKGGLKVIVALVDTELNIRIFDAGGEKVFDKAEPDYEVADKTFKTFAALKERLTPFPEESNLSKTDKQDIIDDAIAIAGLSQRIIFDPPLADCLAGKMVINGNVVQAGHGETQPEKIIGSGDATKLNQSFVLDKEGISFTPDATKNAGVAAAIDVKVAGRVWEQVSSLKDSRADDHHYEIRMTEEGYVKIIFGDGSNGRRLPSGKNNLRVRYRVGSGTEGNVPPQSLIKALKPNPLLDSIAQLLPASGGGDMEDQTSLRENAPPTLLALKRAVSLSDFSHLAASQSSIWQAKAYSEPLQGGRLSQVTVIVVPAGGILSDEQKNKLQDYLQRHSLPAVKVCVLPYEPQIINLSVTVRIDSAAYIPQDVAAGVKQELIDQLSLKKRRLGDPLYLSEVYKVVEGIEGVENSVCVLDGDDRVTKPEKRNSVVYLDTKTGSSLIITVEEFQL
ncbi:MAG: hypothetical protein GY806_21810 [Gammaproteobacteria bacterium]|nr:hypothetical protein [Gammaproteobacteria bacterium]